MKKLAAALTIVGVLALPAFSLAESITPGVQSTGGTITSYGGGFSNGGIETFTASAQLKINGSAVDTVACGSVPYIDDFSYPQCTTSSTGSWSFNSGDDLEVACYNNKYTDYGGTDPTYACGTYGLYINGTLTSSGGGGSTGTAITMPTSTAQSLTATIGAQFADPGTLLVIGLVAGIPLTFYVMEQLIALLPGNSKNRRK